MTWQLDCNPALKLEVRRCPRCGDFWAQESRHAPAGNLCAHCRGVEAAKESAEQKEAIAGLTRQLIAQRGATTRAGNGRKR